ncbi:hypothetical protein [Streptomyces sp. NBC_00687]|nr:hypothetical protein [Streptomyces sp. NBC_00687]MCX4919927.1 hypothetical protein [Streptomyces sp. NBC_00687]
MYLAYLLIGVVVVGALYAMTGAALKRRKAEIETPAHSCCHRQCCCRASN